MYNEFGGFRWSKEATTKKKPKFAFRTNGAAKVCGVVLEETLLPNKTLGEEKFETKSNTPKPSLLW